MFLTNILTSRDIKRYKELVKQNDEMIARLKEALANTNNRDKVDKIKQFKEL